jgi:hypothetical protein
MARRTVRIEIPVGSPDDLIKLAENIINHHASLGSAAELDGQPVSDMVNLAAQAKAKRTEADRLAQRAQTLNEEAATLLGIAATKNTALYHITGIRDVLLPKHRGTEEALGDYSFKVVTGTARTPGPRKTNPA